MENREVMMQVHQIHGVARDAFTSMKWPFAQKDDAKEEFAHFVHLFVRHNTFEEQPR